MRRPPDVSSRAPWSFQCCLTSGTVCPWSRFVLARPAYSLLVSVTSAVTSHGFATGLRAGRGPSWETIVLVAKLAEAARQLPHGHDLVLIRHIRRMGSSS